MAQTVKRIDQQRHELKALRYLLDAVPGGRTPRASLPSRADFQIPDCQRIYDALIAAATPADAIAAIAALDLDDTDVDSFLRLGGEHYYTYPTLVKERGERFRLHELEIVE